MLLQRQNKKSVQKTEQYTAQKCVSYFLFDFLAKNGYNKISSSGHYNLMYYSLFLWREGKYVQDELLGYAGRCLGLLPEG
jgi:hypothetical protein